ncbi:hypothetical protein IP91_00714 [Pseudoduganella lurida]|uniref:Uncharacterized protein n=1 Tax=Pseudoduganella lurida TaxID=1036180 RepID=A0A562RM05_9BURK|nr:hypothetical protein [Pseudoduganella lurida]TWI69644.1 hypothetical protein IP91_00714 [Pseudoduganella lurida]
MASRFKHLLGQTIIAAALALLAVVLGGIVNTDSYSRAAGAEARGVDALMRQVAGAGQAGTSLAPGAIR